MYKVKYRLRRRPSGTTKRRTYSSSPSSNRKSSSRHGRKSADYKKGGHTYHHSRRATYRGGKRGRPQHRGRRKMPTFDPSVFINKNPVDTITDAYIPKHSFETFGLDTRLIKTVTEMGITIPTPIQDQIIPEILKGRDVIGLAETGTGKTAAFLLPLIENTLKDKKRQTLVLTPTRELAIQVEQELRTLSRGLGLYSVTCVGGMNIRPQIKTLRHFNQFIIGTPGRIMDLLNRKSFTAQGVTTVVLDEADRMLDMGFIHDMRNILSQTKTSRETLLFSATMTTAAKKFTHNFLNEPITVSVKKKDVTNSIVQDVVPYEHHNKYETLLDLLSKQDFKRVLVFGSMKHSVEKLARKLIKSGLKAESIHGNKSHGQRQRSLKKFKIGEVNILVATDVAARGIHVENITHVINYDLPNTFEDYVHRIGRTGRADKQGKALSFIPIK